MLRVLHPFDMEATCDGISNAARMTSGGLQRHPDVELTEWNVHYPAIYARREAGQPTYLPDNCHTFDVIHIGWHPIVMNTFVEGHFPWEKGSGPLVSVYLNDIPPWSGCPFIDRAEVVAAAEPTPAASLILPYPVPDWLPRFPEPDLDRFTIGCSGVRQDGFPTLRGACESRGWVLQEKLASPESWTSPEEEIARLAGNAVNVCWYHQGRGIAGTPSMCLASRRPLLLNHSPMFAPWWDGGYEKELYLAVGDGVSVESLERALLYVEQDWKDGRLRMPGPRVYQEHGWTRGARVLVETWLAALEAR